MDVVIDTSALLAVILGEAERDRIVELTSGNTLIGPGSIPWEGRWGISKVSRMIPNPSDG